MEWRHRLGPLTAFCWSPNSTDSLSHSHKHSPYPYLAATRPTETDVDSLMDRSAPMCSSEIRPWHQGARALGGWSSPSGTEVHQQSESPSVKCFRRQRDGRENEMMKGSENEKMGMPPMQGPSPSPSTLLVWFFVFPLQCMEEPANGPPLLRPSPPDAIF